MTVVATSSESNTSFGVPLQAMLPPLFPQDRYCAQFRESGAISLTAVLMRFENKLQSLSACAGQVRNFARSSNFRWPAGRLAKRSRAFMASALVVPG